MASGRDPPLNVARRVLCVDDDVLVRDILATYLRHLSFEVETASDGLVAMRLVCEDLTRFRVIVTDNQMPDMDGVELVEKVRRAGFRGRIVFFSSTLPPEAVERVALLGADAIIEKGRPVSEPVAALNRLI